MGDAWEGDVYPAGTYADPSTLGLGLPVRCFATTAEAALARLPPTGAGAGAP